MKRIVTVAWKETLLLIRDPVFLFVQIVMPAVPLLVFGFLFSATLSRIPTAIRDMDGSPESRRLVRELTATPYFVAAEGTGAGTALETGAAEVVLEVPAGFGRKLRTGRSPEFQLLIDGGDVTAARASQTYLERFSSEVGRRLARRPGGRPSPQVQPSMVTWFNSELRDPNFFVPGVMAMILIGAPVILTSLSLVKEKQSGTWTALNAAPIRSGELLAGKLLPYLIQSFVMSAAVIVTGYLVFGLPFRGHVPSFLAGTLLYVVSGIGMGAIISTLSEEEDMAWHYICLYVLLPALVLSGFIYPLTSMPRFAQAVSHAFPIRCYLELLRAVLLKGAGPEELGPHLLTLAGFAAGTFALALLLLHRARRAST